ncbi:hypothetical protein KBY66_11600 [Synechococcus sp. Tobar12-5m-g]|uniref:hypothetical protein n=1 Tax=unclassified Synechococcus TaxID=2626047 RepID=UPI0020CC0FF5|nr:MULTISPECIES: hypothetical protein [unclassified Synechococcus]MCP9773263.1 hypothetical protein [Synechococcus sp. Tobar12-5m-g]MCP9874336.1 hypothetical protein [Synechococcus sp. Cruz CV-v-12]
MGSSPSSEDLARYLEQKGALTKPWLLMQLRLSKLKEEKEAMGQDEYILRVQDAHADLMRMGEFWRGQERETFGASAGPTAL